MKDRIIGLENEFAFLEAADDNVGEPHKRLENILSGGYAHGFIGSGGAQPRLWLRSGGCMYMDLLKLEQASPECRRVRDVVAYNKAAERTLLSLTEGPKGQPLYHFYKTSIAPLSKNGHELLIKHAGLGAHENYLLYNQPTPGLDQNAYYYPLLPFLTTRQLYGGAGWWPDPKLSNFCRSQRAAVTDRVTSSNTTTDQRGILNERWRPLSSVEGHGRFHVIMGDANMLEYALYLKVGATMLVLSMFEEGCLPNWMVRTGVEVDPLRLGALHTFREVSAERDLTRKTLYIYDMVDKTWQRVSPLELQTNFCEAAHRYLKQTRFDSEASEYEAKDIHAKWDETLAALHRNDADFLYGRIDWFTKRRLAEQGIQNFPERSATEIRADIDVLYHELGNEETIYSDLVSGGIAERILTDEELDRATKEGPPPTPERGTRASIRSRAVNEAMRWNRDPRTRKRMLPAPSWTNIDYPTDGIPISQELTFAGKTLSITLKDPLEYISTELEEYLQRQTTQT